MGRTATRALWVFNGFGLLLIGLIAVSWWVTRPLFDERLEVDSLGTLRIAPLDQALTLARYTRGDNIRTILVTGYEDGWVRGISIQRHFELTETDPLAVFATLGYEALQSAPGRSGAIDSIRADQLILPFDPPAAHIGIGTNYLEHARESQVAEKPFVFPKLVQPTRSTSDVARGDSRLLDYEAELGFVALNDITASDPMPQTMGLVLGNDFTDRWSLVRNFDSDLEMGQTGFVEGKSRQGYAPIGNFLVIPKNLDTFYREVQLNLYVNGQLRQRELAGKMIWGPAEMIREILRREDWAFHRNGTTVPLLPRPGTLPRGTIIFSGTPAGVIFKPLNLWNHWLYLQPGDEVVMRSDFLGTLINRVAP